MSELISKQAVLATLDNMDKALDEERTVEKYKELLTECIKVLPSAENKGDLISRQAIIDAIQKLNIPEDMCVFEIISHIEVAIATLPSVENKGTWRHYEGMLYCPKCGAEFYDEIMEYTGDEVPKHCPDCGADMRGNDDEQT